MTGLYRKNKKSLIKIKSGKLIIQTQGKTLFNPKNSPIQINISLSEGSSNVMTRFLCFIVIFICNSYFLVSALTGVREYYLRTLTRVQIPYFILHFTLFIFLLFTSLRLRTFSKVKMYIKVFKISVEFQDIYGAYFQFRGLIFLRFNSQL